MFRKFAFGLGLLTSVTAAVLSSESIAAEPAPSGLAAFQATDCWLNVVGLGATDCGWLTVPERWDRPGVGNLTLPVAIFRPQEPDPSLEPVIYLSGGPGYPALGPGGRNIMRWRMTANSLFPGRSLILFDQRGSGLGAPRLDCPEFEKPRVRWRLSTDPDNFGDAETRARAALSACRDRLRADGHDLTAFNSRQSAADVEALRQALGLERVVLFGISYGTRLALTVMRHYPESIAATVLDSVVPPHAVWSDGEAYGATFDRLFAACAAYQRCSRAYPDLEARLLAALDVLAAKPMILEIDNLKGAEPLYARIDHNVFLAILRRGMFHTGRIPGLPALIADTAAGEYARLRSHAETVFYRGLDFDSGMTLSVICHDWAGRRYRDSDVDGTGPYPYLSDYVFWEGDPWPCRIWQAGTPDPAEGTAVTSAVPSLLLAGGLDGSTPVEWAEMAAESLSAAHVFVFPAIAHVQTFNSPCAHEVVQTFLAEPQSRPTPSCLESLRQPAFLATGGN